MTTIGQQLMDRVTALEAQFADLTLAGPADGPIAPTESMRTISNQIREIQNKLREIDNAAPTRDGGFPNRNHMSPKELMPGVLSDHFKDRWRLRSYKARDFLSIRSSKPSKPKRSP